MTDLGFGHYKMVDVQICSCKRAEYQHIHSSFVQIFIGTILILYIQVEGRKIKIKSVPARVPPDIIAEAGVELFTGPRGALDEIVGKHLTACTTSSTSVVSMVKYTMR